MIVYDFDYIPDEDDFQSNPTHETMFSRNSTLHVSDLRFRFVGDITATYEKEQVKNFTAYYKDDTNND